MGAPRPRQSRRIPDALRDRCLNCLSYTHRVATCRRPPRCLRCHEFWHLARDCKRPSSLVNDSYKHVGSRSSCAVGVEGRRQRPVRASNSDAQPAVGGVQRRRKPLTASGSGGRPRPLARDRTLATRPSSAAVASVGQGRWWRRSRRQRQPVLRSTDHPGDAAADRGEATGTSASPKTTAVADYAPREGHGEPPNRSDA
jgi:hypothetical protein